jgi:hypothetical protein
MSKGHRHRARTVVIVLGVFVGLVLSGALLVRLGRSGAPAGRSAPESITGDDDRSEDDRNAHPAAPAAPAPDRDRAVDAALGFAAAPQAWLYMTDEELTAAIADIAIPTAADRLSADVVEEVARARAELANSAGPVWWVVHPLAWKVERFEGSEATVAVWAFSLLSAADVAIPQTEWTTTTLELEWFENEWRVAAVTDAVGPTPSVGPTDQPWEPEPLDNALEGFTRLTWGER